jgi:hypothetical protein
VQEVRQSISAPWHAHQSKRPRRAGSVWEEPLNQLGAQSSDIM